MSSILHYNIRYLISCYLPNYWQNTITRFMNKTVFILRDYFVILSFKSMKIKYIKSLLCGTKFVYNISNNVWPHVFRSEIGLYVQCFYDYVLGLYFVYYFVLQFSTNFNNRKVLESTISLFLSESNHLHPEYYFPPNNKPDSKYILEKYLENSKD